jgi:hypothetical protein
MPRKVDQHRYLTAAEAMAELECSRITLRRLVMRGLLTERVTTVHRRYLRESVRALAAQWRGRKGAPA